MDNQKIEILAKKMKAIANEKRLKILYQILVKKSFLKKIAFYIIRKG